MVGLGAGSSQATARAKCNGSQRPLWLLCGQETEGRVEATEGRGGPGSTWRRRVPRSDSGYTVKIGLTRDPRPDFGLSRWVNGVTTC